MYVSAYSAVSGRNTERSARPKLHRDNDDGVVVKTYYPRERAALTWRQQVERQWAAKQAAEAAKREAMDKAIASAAAVHAYRTITVISKDPQVSDRISVQSIIHNIAAKHGLTAEIILGPRRSKNIIAARHEAMCEAARLRPDMTLPELGRQFKRDHTSILHCLRKGGVPTTRAARQHSDKET